MSSSLASDSTTGPHRPLSEQLRRALVVAKTYWVGTVDTCVTLVENASRQLGLPHLITPRVCTGPLVGKVCIITGANTGIGLATAEILAARGAHIILACRSKERGDAAAQDLRRRCQLLPGCGQEPQVEVMQVNMSSLKSVHNFCSAFNRRELPLHLLVANAGIMSPSARCETEDGLELQFQVNFLGHWLMAHKLLGTQRQRRARGAQHHATSAGQACASSVAAPHGSLRGAALAGYQGQGRLPGWGLPEGGTRVVLLSSLTHHAGALDWCDMQSRRSYDPFTSYALSKLANVVTAAELQRRLASAAEQPGGDRWGCDSVVAVHPGVVNTYLATNFFKNSQSLVIAMPSSKALVSKLVDVVAPYVFKTPASSAAVVAAAALAPAEQVAGKYLINGRPGAGAREMHDPDMARELWDVSQRLTGLSLHESLAAR